MPRARAKKVKMNQAKEKENEDDQTYVAPFLQQEIISEILSYYLPVTSLLKCKCVCKLWCDIIQEPKFIRKHMTRAKVYGFFDASEREGTFNYITCFNGLVVEKHRVTNKYRIRNPASRQVLLLPDPDVRPSVSMYMFRVSINHDYKLVSFHREIGSQDVSCKILYVSSDDHTWKTLSFPSLQNLARNNARLLSRYIRGAVHFVRMVEANFGDNEIISVDLETGCVSSMKIPRGFFTDWSSVRSMDFNRKLAISAIVNEELHIWVLDDYKKKKWAERKIVHSLPLMKDFANVNEKPVQSAILRDSLWMMFNHQLIIYNLARKEVSRVTPPGKKILGVSSATAVHLKGMQPEERNERTE